MAAERAPGQNVREGHRHYARAPIVEAILQFTFDEPLEQSPDVLSQVARALSVTLPVQSEMRGIEHQIIFGPEGSQALPPRSAPAGYQLQDAPNGHRVVRAQANATSIHEVQPYEGWNSYRAFARSMFETYVGLTKVKSVSRVGLRYINRIDLPGNTGDLREWIVTLPDIPEGLPQLVSSFSTEVAMPQPDYPGVMAIVRQALMTTQTPGTVPILLDIELISSTKLPVEAVWGIVDEMHERENLIFECTITDKVRSVIA